MLKCCCADIIEMQAVDRDLFSFVLQLLQHNAESTHRKLRRTEPSASSSPVRQTPSHLLHQCMLYTAETSRKCAA